MIRVALSERVLWEASRRARDCCLIRALYLERASSESGGFDQGKSGVPSSCRGPAARATAISYTRRSFVVVPFGERSPVGLSQRAQCLIRFGVVMSTTIRLARQSAPFRAERLSPRRA